MRVLASQVAEAVGGRLDGPDRAIEGANFDSRDLAPGQLFVPIVAERDGHEFIPAALDAGAAAYLTAREPVGGTAIVVDDTASALMALAGWARDRLDVPVVGVTGSVGKTSAKDLIAAALRSTRRVAANVRSFNNEQGLPVTILGAPDDADVLVLEMGMRGFGEIARLCDVARPTIGVVGAHTERVGSIDGVERSKRELIEALPADGVAVLNADDERVARMASVARGDVVTFGAAGDVRFSAISLDDLARATFTVDSPWGSGEVSLAVSGAHMVSNAVAALAVAGVIEGSIDGAIAAMASATISGMRMQVERSVSGAVVVNDAYNANPASMRAAFETVAAMAGRRRIALLGPMAELDDPGTAHREVAAEARRLGIEVAATKTDLYDIDPVDDIDEVLERLGGLGPGDIVLVKASRSAGLETVARALLTH
jgi:UDP-N-acetylmuramoyl-tripeptide--D-alanyl-D-alanine ligase